MRYQSGTSRNIDEEEWQSLEWASDLSSSDTGQIRGIKICYVGGSSSNFSLPTLAEATHQHQRTYHRDLLHIKYEVQPPKCEGGYGSVA